jgi:hypothetical protein
VKAADLQIAADDPGGARADDVDGAAAADARRGVRIGGEVAANDGPLLL